MNLTANEIIRNGGNPAKPLLNRVSLSLAGGQRLAVVGPSGSGKTLLLRALSMLDPIDGGEIRFDGSQVPPRGIPQFRSRVIYLHQRPALLEGTVEFNLRYPFSLRSHRDRRFDRDWIIACLKQIGRDESFLARHSSELSGGEAQIAVLLRALQLEPQILILDEPTSALDETTTGQFETLVSDWFQQSPRERAILWVTHDSKQAARIADRVLAINQGRIEEAG